MTPEQQRIAIAEACGWASAIQITKNYWVACKDGSPLKPIPHYTSDLNAMHEAEKVLDRVQRSNYVSKLGLAVAARGFSDEVDFHMEYVCSTAAQRAEAFLRTLNLWVES